IFFNAFLVGSIGGDAVKSLILIGRGETKTSSLLSTLLDRLCGLAVLLILGCSFILINWSLFTSSPISSSLVHIALLSLLLTVLFVFLTFWLASHGHSGKIPRWFPARSILQNACSQFTLFLSQWKKTLLAAAYSALMLFCYFNVFYCASRAFGLNLNYPQFLGIMPVIDIYTFMPISVGGIGVREKLFVSLLGDLFQTPQAAAVCVSLAGYLIALSWGLVGLASLPFFHNLLAKGKALENSLPNSDTPPTSPNSSPLVN
ncbi:MAG: flippase-like domain-containing protein, partial [Chthoniobacterales bacterium]|nr:flippase-like domain-containing protein [Chthoniobacterales bacterium]